MAPKLHGTNPRAQAACRQRQAAYERAERIEARRARHTPIGRILASLREAAHPPDCPDNHEPSVTLAQVESVLVAILGEATA